MEHLDEAAVIAHLDVTELDGALEAAFADLGHGRAASTVRVRAATEDAMVSAMAAAVPSLGVTGGKVYATVAGTFTFHIVLFDVNGTLLCTMDGAGLTEARTASASAMAIRRFARPRSSVVAVLGTGREAAAHVDMLARAIPVDEVRIWGRRRSAAEVIADRGRRLGVPTVVVDTAATAVVDADVVVTVTSADDPIVDQRHIADHALVCAVGATKPQRCELEPALFSRAAAVVTDSADGARQECGDLIRAVDAGTFSWDRLVEVSDVMADLLDVPRAGESGPIVFESQGTALQDVVAACLVWQRARAASSPDRAAN